MKVIVLNYDSGRVDIVDVPKGVDVEYYLFDCELDYKESQVSWMEVEVQSVINGLAEYFKDKGDEHE